MRIVLSLSRSIIVISLLYLYVPEVLCQKGYYSTDSTTIGGVTLNDNRKIKNAKYCQVVYKTMTVEFTPEDIKGYGFLGGKTYRSFEVDLNGKNEFFFLERLEAGKLDLYYLRSAKGIRKYYILEENGSLNEIPVNKEELQDFFTQYLSLCQRTQDYLQYATHNRYSLVHLVKYINICTSLPFPHLQFGFKTGLSGAKLKPVKKDSYYGTPEYSTMWNLSFGVFADLPIRKSNYSFHPELIFNLNNDVFIAFEEGNAQYDLSTDYSSISAPLLLKYTFLNDKISPYILAGPVYSFTLKNKGYLFEYTNLDNNILIEIIDSPILQQHLAGLSLSSGILLNTNHNYSWRIEARINKLFNLNRRNAHLDLIEFSICTGIIF